MIVYNITTKVDSSITGEWLVWAREFYLPAIISTACFKQANIYRLLEADEMEGLTYIIQLRAESLAFYDKYSDDHAPAIRQRALDKWGNKCIAFHSVMEVVQ